MNKKKLNIILIPSVIIIWIAALYRIFSLTGSVSSLPDSSLLLSESKENNISTYDTVDLLLDYRDPFEAIEYFFKEIIEFEPSPVIEELIIPQEVIPPSIRYIGLIEKNNKTHGVALAFIDDRSHLLSVGDTLMGFEVKKIDRDSLVVEFNKMRLKYLK